MDCSRKVQKMKVENNVLQENSKGFLEKSRLKIAINESTKWLKHDKQQDIGNNRWE